MSGTNPRPRSGESADALAALVAAIAHSPIVVKTQHARPRLPRGFDAVDAAILDWIAGEGRRAGRFMVRM